MRFDRAAARPRVAAVAAIAKGIAILSLACAVGAVGQVRFGAARTPPAAGFGTVAAVDDLARWMEGSVLAMADLRAILRGETDPSVVDSLVDALVANAPRGGWSIGGGGDSWLLDAIRNNASRSGTPEDGERRIATIVESMTDGRFVRVRTRHAIGQRVEVRPVAMGDATMLDPRFTSRLTVRSVTLDGVEPADLRVIGPTDATRAISFLPGRMGKFALRVEGTLSLGAFDRRAPWWSRDFVEERMIEVVGQDEPLLVPTSDANVAQWSDPGFEWELALGELGDEQAICLVVRLRDRADIAVVGSWWLTQDDRAVRLGPPLRAVGAHPNRMCVWSGGTVVAQRFDRSRSMTLRFVPDPDAMAQATAERWPVDRLWVGTYEIRTNGDRTRWRRDPDGWHSTMSRRQ